MKKNTINTIRLLKINNNNGFSLIESAVALTILAMVLAYSAPVLLFSKLNNTKNEIRIGALAISQKVFDRNRGKAFDQIGKNSAGLAVATEETDEIAGGRTYRAKVSHCIADIADPCDAEYKRMKIEITEIKTNTLVYEIDTALTSFR
jgi:prepilin-type N-terminal cleavage/methylation domain-containing protein